MRKLSKTGYRKDSPDKNNPYNVIPSGRISMQDVPHNVFGMDELGNQQLMQPGEEYNFPGNFVFETPVMQQGGSYTAEQWNQMNEKKGLVASPGNNVNISGINKYLDFYDPKMFQPSVSGQGNTQEVNWKNIQNPNWQYTNESNSPFISYKPSYTNNNKSYVNSDSNRTAVEFQPNYTTYKYKDGSVKYQDTKGNLYDNGDQLMNYLQGVANKKFGGPLDKFTSNYAKKQINNMQAPQGLSMDQYLTDKNSEFVNFISGNAQEALFRDEVINQNSDYKQMGGPNVILDDPNNPLKSRTPNPIPTTFPTIQQGQDPSINITVDPKNAFYNSKFGIYAEQPVPDYVTQHRDVIASNIPEQKGLSKSDWADLGMAGAQTINNLFDKARAYKQNQFNQNKMTIDQTAQLQYGNRGDYDINSGIFRPDQYVPTQYQMGGSVDKYMNADVDNLDTFQLMQSGKYIQNPEKRLTKKKVSERESSSTYKKGGEKKFYKTGGEHSLSKAEISALINQGYKLEFLD